MEQPQFGGMEIVFRLTPPQSCSLGDINKGRENIPETNEPRHTIFA